MTARASRAKPATDYHKKPVVSARMDAGTVAWARDEAERRGQPFGDFMDGLITAERDNAADLLTDCNRQLDRCRHAYRALLDEAIAGLATTEHEKVTEGGLPFCRCGLSLAGGMASESFISHALAVLTAERDRVASRPPALVAASQEQPPPARSHAQTCKCGTCQPKGNGR